MGWFKRLHDAELAKLSEEEREWQRLREETERQAAERLKLMREHPEEYHWFTSAFRRIEQIYRNATFVYCAKCKCGITIEAMTLPDRDVGCANHLTDWNIPADRVAASVPPAGVKMWYK